MRLIALSVLSAFMLFSNIADAKFNNFHLDENATKQPTCYKESNMMYNSCMRGCVSHMSPDYIVEGCFYKCIKPANEAYINCLRTGKFKERKTHNMYGWTEVEE